MNIIFKFVWWTILDLNNETFFIHIEFLRHNSMAITKNSSVTILFLHAKRGTTRPRADTFTLSIRINLSQRPVQCKKRLAITVMMVNCLINHNPIKKRPRVCKYAYLSCDRYRFIEISAYISRMIWEKTFLGDTDVNKNHTHFALYICWNACNLRFT